MRFTKLNDWLNWQQSLNPKEIELGLERISRVLMQAGLSTSFNCPLITVAGTNGKGSTVAFLESIAMAAGLKICSYTSPHLLKYNERIKINGAAVDDNVICDAFSRLDRARGDEQLTYFEFGTLAAIDIFFQQQTDLIILEVGLGGRLDAVNIMDADISILTSVAIDHVDWLGDDREQIGFEKAGVFREAKVVICGDANPPQSVLATAEKLHCEFLQFSRDFSIVDKLENNCWNLQSSTIGFEGLALPALAGDFQKINAAVAIMALSKIASISALLSSPVLDSALSSVSLCGRFQQIYTAPNTYLDVAHNPQAAFSLNSQLQNLRGHAVVKIWAIVAMLQDKDVVTVLDTVAQQIDFWCLAGLEKVNRGMAVSTLAKSLRNSCLPAASDEQISRALHNLKQNQCTMMNDDIMLSNTVTQACKAVLERADVHDIIIIFGSFFTVAEATVYFSDIEKRTELSKLFLQKRE